MKFKLLFVFLFLFFPVNQSFGFIIVKANKPCASIVIPDNPMPVTEFAATELQSHIKKSTGAVLPIVKEGEKPTGTGLIYLGNCRRTSEAGIDGQKCAPNGFIIRLIGTELFLCGQDSAGEPLGILHNNYTRVGTLFAVYELLEKTMGVKWLWPGELGTVIPKLDNLVIEKYNQTWEPGIVSKRWRDGEGSYWGIEDWPSKDWRAFYIEEQSKWLRRHRFALGMNIDMGHSYSDYWGRFSNSHPEYFNLLPDGSRKPDPYYYGGEPTLISMSVSEPGLWKQKVSDWESRDSSGWIIASENDTAGKCVCEKCLSWDEPDAGLEIPFAKRLEYAKAAFEKKDADWARYLGSLSDRYGKFYLAIQKEAEKINPNAVVAGYAYGNYSKPPQKVKLNERIIIGIVPPIMFPWTEQKMKDFYTQWDGWRAAGVRETLRPNYMLDGYCFPVFFADKLGLQLSHAVKNGLIAADFDSLTGQWATQGPNLYMLARSLERPELGPDKILQEYYQGFGKAASRIKEYFDYWKKVSDGVSDNFYLESGGDWSNFLRFAPKLFTDEVMGEGFRILEKAKEAAAGDELSGKRVLFLEKGLTNAQLALKALKARKEYQMGGLAEEYRTALKQLDDFRKNCEPDLIGNMAFLAWEDGRTFGLRDNDALKASANENLKEIPGLWKFGWDEKNNGEEKGWYKEEFDDSGWDDVSVRAFYEDTEAGKSWKEKHGTDYLGTVWYRKNFPISAPASLKRYRIVFGAVDEACKIWVNGKFILDRPYPYQGDKDSWKKPFEIDITPFVRYDKPNILVVKVDNLAGAGGIWKNVWLADDASAISENNLMPNPGFEEKTEPWQFHTAAGKFESGLDTNAYFSGHSSAFINCLAFALNSENAVNPEDKSWARWYQIIPVEKSKKYQLSVWVKISTDFSSSGGTVGIWSRSIGGEPKSLAISSTGGLWKKVEIKDITPGENKCNIYLNTIGGRGKVWFDDVEFSEIKN